MGSHANSTSGGYSCCNMVFLNRWYWSENEKNQKIHHASVSPARYLLWHTGVIGNWPRVTRSAPKKFPSNFHSSPFDAKSSALFFTVVHKHRHYFALLDESFLILDEKLDYFYDWLKHFPMIKNRVKHPKKQNCIHQNASNKFLDQLFM